MFTFTCIYSCIYVSAAGLAKLYDICTDLFFDEYDNILKHAHWTSLQSRLQFLLLCSVVFLSSKRWKQKWSYFADCKQICFHYVFALFLICTVNSEYWLNVMVSDCEFFWLSQVKIELHVFVLFTVFCICVILVLVELRVETIRVHRVKQIYNFFYFRTLAG